jgi:hypothetical protein
VVRTLCLSVRVCANVESFAAMDMIGLLADLSGGQVEIVNPLEMSAAVGALLERRALATAVRVRMLLGTDLTFRDALAAPAAPAATAGAAQSSTSPSSVTQRVIDVGAASNDSDVAVRFDLTRDAVDAVAAVVDNKPADASVKQRGERLRAHGAPCQLQVEFVLPSGEQRCRTITTFQPISVDRVDVEVCSACVCACVCVGVH